MALLDLQAELARSTDETPFANGFEGSSWQALWCFECVTDEDSCPLISVAMLGRTPAAWIERDPGGLNKFTCLEHREIVYQDHIPEGMS